jgi:polyphosphate kinase
MQIQLNDNVKARILDKDLKNERNKGADDLAVRSQVETYYMVKRKNEAEEFGK